MIGADGLDDAVTITFHVIYLFLAFNTHPIYMIHTAVDHMQAAHVL